MKYGKKLVLYTKNKEKNMFTLKYCVFTKGKKMKQIFYNDKDRSRTI